MDVVFTILMIINISAIIYVFLLGYDGLIKLCKSLYRLVIDSDTIHYIHRKHKLSADNIMPVTIILPDCGRDSDGTLAIKELMDLDYPLYEVIATCDSKKHGELFLALLEEFRLIPVEHPAKISIPTPAARATYRSPHFGNLIVVDMDCSSRHDAINSAINYSLYPLLVILGIGYTINTDSMSEIATLFSGNYHIVASGGLPRIHEHRHSIGMLGSLQETEYLRTFPVGSTYQGKQRLSVILSSFGAFRKQNVVAIGGFPPGGNETDMVVRLSKSVAKDNKETRNLELPPNPVLDTEPLRSVGTLVRQRMEWESAMFFTLRSNKNMLFNPKYGKTGMIDIPYMWLMKIIGPIIECLGLITIPVSFALGFIGLEILILFFALEFIFGTLVSLSAIASQQILDNERPSIKRLLRQVLSAIVNNFGYRQILLFFSVAGLFMRRKSTHKTE